jgi:hypothetical protein
VITKKGQIKKISVKDLEKVGKGGKRVFSLYKKERCEKHSSKLEDHRNSECCKGKGLESFNSCDKFKNIQKDIRECVPCMNFGIDHDNNIVKAVLVGDKDDMSAILKRKRGKDERIDNFRYSIFSNKRRRDEEGNLIYCERHCEELKNHSKKIHDCGINCMEIREMQVEVKKCPDCQNPAFFARKIKKQIKCEEVVDLVVNNIEENQKDLLFLVKEDNSCEKRQLSSIKGFICTDSKQKKTTFCKEH